jgi:hypothetical protein
LSSKTLSVARKTTDAETDRVGKSGRI